ncbi:MAG: hypothetical protein HGA80_06860 [Candidatus Omnitrophica bacterium]|nr:hypothetical protein [Candidatus Omnitrophota bacterium]
MQHPFMWMLTALVTLSFIGRPVCADELILDSGKRLQGRIISLSNNTVNFETTSNELVVPVGKIRSVGTDSIDLKVLGLVEELRDQISVDSKRRREIMEHDVKERLHRQLAEEEKSRQANVAPSLQARSVARADKSVTNNNGNKINKTNRKIDVYVRPGCPWCKKMEGFLKENGIRYNRFDIEQDASAKLRFGSKGGKAVPFTVVDNKITLAGYEPDSLMKILER